MIETHLKGFKTFDEIPVIDDILFVYRNYTWVQPFAESIVKGVPLSLFMENCGVPRFSSFLERIKQNSLDVDIIHSVDILRELLNFEQDFDNLMVEKEYFKESALGSIQLKLELALPLILKMFQKEQSNLGWDLNSYDLEELSDKFKVYLYPHPNQDGSLNRSLGLNLEALKELLIKIQI